MSDNNPPAYEPEVVAIINTGPDTVEMLRQILEAAGFVVVTGYVHHIREGQLDLEAFVQQHAPDVIVWDIAPPYERQWNFFQHMKARVPGKHKFVLTTTNAKEVQKVAGASQHVHEIVGRSDDLGELVRSVKEAIRERPTR